MLKAFYADFKPVHRRPFGFAIAVPFPEPLRRRCGANIYSCAARFDLFHNVDKLRIRRSVADDGIIFDVVGRRLLPSE